MTHICIEILHPNGGINLLRRDSGEPFNNQQYLKDKIKLHATSLLKGSLLN